jgi:hypothetical protein
MRVTKKADQQGSHAVRSVRSLPLPATRRAEEKLAHTVEFVNSRAEFVTFTNGATAEDGWMHVATVGDFVGIAREMVNGVEKKTKAVQRLDKAALAQMTNSISHRGVTKFLTAPVLYLGHPNKDPHLYPDREPKGVFVNARHTDTDMFAEPVLTADGEKLVASKKYPGISGHWDTEDTGEFTNDGMRIFRPLNFLSAGLVKQPNLPTFLNDNLAAQTPSPAGRGQGEGPEFSNEATSASAMSASKTAAKATAATRADGGDTAQNHQAALDAHAKASDLHSKAADLARKDGDSDTADMHDGMAAKHDGKMIDHIKAIKKAGGKPEMCNDRATTLAAQCEQADSTDMNKTKIVPLIVKAAIPGVEVTNDSTDAQLEAALGKLVDQAGRAGSLETQFTNEREARITDLCAGALKLGQITEAEKPDWQRRLKADFTNEVAALAKLPPKVKVTPLPARGDRQPENMTPAQRTQFCNTAIVEIAKEAGLDPVKDYSKVFNLAQSKRPDLFKGMKRSAFNTPAKN